MLADPYGAELTAPMSALLCIERGAKTPSFTELFSLPFSACSPVSIGGEGDRLKRYGFNFSFTQIGPIPGPPPPCGIANVLCRLRWQTSAPILPGEVSPTCAFIFAPSI